jgi:mono/diheme cytochrome c family protein
MKKMMLTAAALLPLITACGEENNSALAGEDSMANEQVTPEREVDFAKVARGSRLYQMNCAECHGDNAQGAPNWRQQDADGNFPPPPLNGTGHAWHHPKKMLHYVIANGSPGGQGNMPAWGDELSDDDIDAIIAWFQSRWPDQVYAAWYRRNQSREQEG